MGTCKTCSTDFEGEGENCEGCNKPAETTTEEVVEEKAEEVVEPTKE